MSNHVAPFILDKESGVGIFVCWGNPGALGLVVPKGSLVIDASTPQHYISLSSVVSSFMQAGGTPPPASDLAGYSWKAWIDAAQVTGLANNDPATFLDYSGEGNNPTVSGGPVYKTAGLAGLPAFYFDGSDDYFTFPSGAFDSLSNVEIFAVLQCDTNTPGDSTSGLWTMGLGDNTHYPYTDGNLYENAGSTTRRNAGNPALDVSTAHVYSVYSHPAEWTLYHNGVSIFTTPTNTVDMPSSAMFGRSPTTHRFKGHMAKLLIGPARTTLEREAIIDILMTEYSIV